MRSTTVTRSLILGSVLAGAITLGAVQLASGDSGANEQSNPSSPSAQTTHHDNDTSDPKTTTVRERGIVLEGTGSWRGQPVQVFVYQNRQFGNSLQIVVGDPDGDHAIGSGEGRDPYVIHGVLNVGLDVDGDLAVVKGSVAPSGDPRPAPEPDPDGELIGSTGTHTPLLVEATFEYRGDTAELEFDKAYRYDLEATRARH